MLPPGPVLHVVIQAQKRHQAGTACWRRQTDERWQSLLNRQISASLLSLHQMQWSTRRGGVLDGERSSYKAKWPRPYPGRRGGGGSGEVDRDSAFGRLAELYYGCLYGVPCYSVYVPIFPRAPLRPARRASPCSLWENCRKQTRLPSSFSPFFSQSLSLSFSLASYLNYISSYI